MRAKPLQGLKEHTDRKIPGVLLVREVKGLEGKKSQKKEVKMRLHVEKEEDRSIIRESESEGKPIGMPSCYKEDLCLCVWYQVMLELSGSHTPEIYPRSSIYGEM